MMRFCIRFGIWFRPAVVLHCDGGPKRKEIQFFGGLEQFLADTAIQGFQAAPLGWGKIGRWRGRPQVGQSPGDLAKIRLVLLGTR